MAYTVLWLKSKGYYYLQIYKPLEANIFIFTEENQLVIERV